MLATTNRRPSSQQHTDIYARVSGRAQEDGYSLDTQIEACEAYCAANGYLVAETWREVFSGTDLWNRPHLTRMRNRIATRQIERVVVFDIDRFSRDPEHLIVLLSEAERSGVEIEFVREPLDDSPEGALIRFVKGYAAKREHEQIRERTQRGKLARVKSGIPLAAKRPPFGMMWDANKKRLLEDPRTAPIVRRIYSSFSNGGTLRKIAGDLTRDGIPTPGGNSPYWYPQTVRYILTNPQYIDRGRGWITRDYARSAATRHTSPNAVEFPSGTFPQLVTNAEFDAVQDRLKKSKAQASCNNKAPKQALLRGGFARCRYCGRVPHVASRESRKGREPFTLTYYRCDGHPVVNTSCPRPQISVKVLDGIVWEKISTFMREPEVILAELRRTERDDPVTGDLAHVDGALRENSRRQHNLRESLALADDAKMRKLVMSDISRLMARQRELEIERTVLEDRRRAWLDTQVDTSNLARWCEAMAETVDDLDYETRRLLLDALDVQVFISQGNDEEEERWEIKAALPLDIPQIRENVSSFDQQEADPMRGIAPSSSSTIVTCTT